LATASLLEANRDVTGLYTFGSPRVGDQNFAQAFTEKIGDRTFRVVNGNDIVPRVPPQLNGYKHVGEVIFFNAQGKLEKGPTVWAQLKAHVKIQLTADILDRKISSVSHHLLDSPDGYLVGLQKNL
jgi:triacylglycerol lipase